MATGSKDEYCMGETQGEAIEVLVLNICAFVQGYMEFCCMPWGKGLANAYGSKLSDIHKINNKTIQKNANIWHS